MSLDTPSGLAPMIDDDARRALQSALQACRREVTERVRNAQRTSENEVVAIGAAINDIVDNAKAYIARTDTHLRSQHEGSERTSSMVREMIASVHQQEETVHKAMAQSSAILRAGRDVQAMASATRLLSLNARVEASRLGDQGSSFSVIADEMRELSHAVQETNRSVASMAKELERLLPMISEQTKSIQSQFEEFTTHVDAQLNRGRDNEASSTDGSTSVVDKIVAAAYEALSHLAFQDPMAQSLARIVDSLDDLENKLEVLAGHADAADTSEPVEDDADSVAAGEMLMF